MAGGDLLVDHLVAGGFVRPVVLLRGLQLCRPAHRQLLDAFGRLGTGFLRGSWMCCPMRN